MNPIGIDITTILQIPFSFVVIYMAIRHSEKLSEKIGISIIGVLMLVHAIWKLRIFF